MRIVLLALKKTYTFVVMAVLMVLLGARKIRVNAINPGMIETEGVHAAGFIESDFRKEIEAQTPLGRIGQPDDIAPTAVYLASSDSKYMTGETLLVSGGLR
jgi:3-oxoacyl-[acyl-carrier protein] reductase